MLPSRTTHKIGQFQLSLAFEVIFVVTFRYNATRLHKSQLMQTSMTCRVICIMLYTKEDAQYDKLAAVVSQTN